ncbi:hypothetical protein ACTMTI_11195 [Nonomuraea sp. H19]|uniref:hypothetical protein n=1 Tax=Nonomuraea sp. H19 TaxID=3452206 RepID=UPI003F8A1059
MRALELIPSAVADGVDISPHALSSAERGLSDRLSLHLTPAAEFSTAEPYDLVLCQGSTHVFGGLENTMDAAARLVLQRV